MKTQTSSLPGPSLALALALALASAAASADVVIPSTVFRRGAGNAEFRSDVRVFNPSTTSPVNYTPVLYDQVTGQTFTAPIQTIPPRAQQSFDNIVGGPLFGRTLDQGSFGPIRFQTTGTLIVSSSVNNYNACGNGSVSGQWLPGLDATSALKAGTLVQLASSVNLQTGYRTNVVFTNPGAADATVNAKVHRSDGSFVAATVGPLGPNGFKQISNWSDFPGIDGANDTNLWLEFTSDQPVLVYASVINNASGDPFAIVMTSEPGTAPAAPVASYAVTPASPAAGQAATFTDTSSNSPTTLLWAFGDGTTATSGATVQHTYAAAGTYRTSHFAANAGGVSGATKDVVVTAAQPIAVTISATTTGNTKWTFVCQSPASVCSGAGNNNVNLKVGQPYTITWSTPASEARTHGVSAIGALGILSQCDVVTPSSPCTVSLTPTTQMLTAQTVAGGNFLYACTQSACAPTSAQHTNMTGTITIVP